MTTASERRRGPYAKSAARRRELIAAADQVFTSRGYRASSLREVAAVAGTTLSTLQHHFPVKEDLLLEVLRKRDLDEPSQPPLGDGDRFLRHVLERARANESVPGLVELYSVLAGEATTEHHPARPYFADRFATLRAVYQENFEQLRAEGRLRAGVEPEVAATSLIAMWDGLQLQWLMAPDEVDVVAALAGFLDLVVQD
jgi:AcrR family transcriptional regulator